MCFKNQSVNHINKLKNKNQTIISREAKIASGNSQPNETRKGNKGYKVRKEEKN